MVTELVEVLNMVRQPRFGGGALMVAFALGTEQGPDPERIVVREQHLQMGSIRDGVSARDLLGAGIEDGEEAGEEAIGLQLLSSEVEEISVVRWRPWSRRERAPWRSQPWARPAAPARRSG